MSYSRPTTVVVIVAALAVATVLAAGVAAELLYPNRWLDPIWRWNPPAAAFFLPNRKPAGMLLLLLAGGTASASRGLLRGRRWAWWFAVTLFAVDVLGNLVSLVVLGDWLRSVSGAAISGAFLYSLTRPAVRRYF